MKKPKKTAPAPKPVAAPKPASRGKTALVAGIVLSGVASGYGFINAASGLPSSATHSSSITGFAFLGLALGLLAARMGWFESNARLPRAALLGSSAVLALGIGFLITQFGMVQFGGFDHSVLVDVAWRQIHGQKPHVDFPCTLPVGFFVGAKYAFQLFGVTWRALILFTAFFSVATFFWSVWLLIRLFGNYCLALLWAVTLQSLTLLLCSYWWYNPITSVASVIFLFSAVLWWRSPNDPGARISYFFALLLIAAMKPNIGGILIPWVTFVFLRSPRHRLPVIAISAGSFCAFMVFLWGNHVGLVNLIKGYLTVAKRGGSVEQFLQDLEAGPAYVPYLAFGLAFLAYALAMLPSAVSVYRARGRRLAPATWIPIGAIVAGTYGFLTNGELKLVDVSLILFASLTLAATVGAAGTDPVIQESTKPWPWASYATALCITLAFTGLGEAATRHRVKAIGPMMFFEYEMAPEPIPAGFFKGLRAGEMFMAANRQIADLLHKAPGATIAFGPRMQWAYAAFNETSPPNQPIWWHPGVSFSAKDEQIYMDRFFDSHFDLIGLYKYVGTPYMSDTFIQCLTQHYTIDQSYSALTVLRKKKE